MVRAFARIFIDHPRSVDETYFEHMRFAGWFAVRLLMAGCAAIIHAVIPCRCCQTNENSHRIVRAA